MELLFIIISLASLLLSIYFLSIYVENLSVIFCIGLKRYNTSKTTIKKTVRFSNIEVVMMIILASVFSLIINFLVGFKFLFLVLGLSMILGLLRSWGINKFLQ
jgi:hypothetical protein